MSRGKIHIGTSGWHYDAWVGDFYPEDLASGEWLAYYLERFSTVEVNNTFYQLPDPGTLEHWRDAAPEDFVFAVKGSRYITHRKRLLDPEETVPNFLDRVDLLDEHLGPIIFQLPPHWHFNGPRLASFLDALPPGYRYAFELRDPEWLNAEAYAMLAAHNAAFCIYDFDHRLSPKEVTADFVYVRLHGPGDPYSGSYDTQTLAGWAGAFSTWADQGKDVYCYFDNTQAGYAVHNALELKEMVA